MPTEFVRFLDYVRKMHFKSQPDYKYLQLLFRKAAQANDILYDSKFDWLEFDRKQQEA
jgi:casein kinase I family protein HRR25